MVENSTPHELLNLVRNILFSPELKCGNIWHGSNSLFFYFKVLMSDFSRKWKQILECQRISKKELRFTRKQMVVFVDEVLISLMRLKKLVGRLTNVPIFITWLLRPRSYSYIFFTCNQSFNNPRLSTQISGTTRNIYVSRFLVVRHTPSCDITNHFDRCIYFFIFCCLSPLRSLRLL